MKLLCSILLALCVTARAEDISPRIGIIEIYGAHKVSAKKIRALLGVSEGGLLPASRANVEERLDKVSGIVASRIEAACCDENKMVLYVGVEEKDAPHLEFHPAPTGDVVLPSELVDHYRAFLDAVDLSLRHKHPDQDLTNGYSLMSDADCREHQEYFLAFAKDNLPILDKVVRESGDAEQRATAAYILQYGPRGPHTTGTVLNALQYALQDTEDTVRANAIESLKAAMVGGQLHPDQEIHLESTWFVELMNSVVWTDRRDASLALVTLTEQRDPAAMQLLRERALTSVLEMARWRDLEHALPGFLLAGRLAGLTDDAIKAAWVKQDREPVLQKALYPNGKPSMLGGVASALRKEGKKTDPDR